MRDEKEEEERRGCVSQRQGKGLKDTEIRGAKNEMERRAGEGTGKVRQQMETDGRRCVRRN